MMIFVQPTNYQEALRIIIQSVHPHEVLYQDEAAILYGLNPKTISSRKIPPISDRRSAAASGA